MTFYIYIYHAQRLLRVQIGQMSHKYMPNMIAKSILFIYNVKIHPYYSDNSQIIYITINYNYYF